MSEEITPAPVIILDAQDCKFSPGQVVCTRGALAAMQEYEISPSSLLRRHISGDWGNVPVEDAQLNDLSLKTDGRLLSSYDIAQGVRIWLITEWDRSVTTYLLPSEY